ncbi:unnamed protein product [Peniophora sp. CBMAI 1063]|nr:unnamed protein product [Peniophora sp. CBMAI 1063]
MLPLSRHVQTGTSSDAQSFWDTTVRSRLGGPASAGPHNREARRLRLEQELLALRRAEHYVMRLRNMQTGTCSLPAEVLTAIFAWVQGIWPPSRREPTSKTKAPNRCYGWGWITVTHVSSYWREVALNAPSLWTTQTYCADINHNFIPDIILRSRGSPLDLSFNIISDVHKDFYGAGVQYWLLPAISRRIRKLSLKGLPAKETSSLSVYLSSKDLWTIEHLEIHVRRSSDGLSDELEEMFREWKAGDAPRLRSLSLSGVKVHWGSAIFSSSLTHLNIDIASSTTNVASDFPSYMELFSALSHLDKLETLHLCQVFPRRDPDTTPPLLYLPQSLRHLHLEADEPYARRVFLCIPNLVIPMHTSVCLIARAEYYSFKQAVDLALPRLWARIPVKELVLDNMSVHSYAIERTQREQWTIPWSFCKGSEPDGGFYVMIMDEAGENPLPHQVLDQPLDALTAFTLTTEAMSYFGSSVESTYPSWQDRLATAVNVTRVSVQMQESRYVLDAMAQLVEDGDTGFTRFRAFPRVRTLVFFVGRVERAFAPRGMQWNVADAVALAELVRVRMEHGVPLEEVAVEDEIQHWSLWESIRPMVGSLVFFKDNYGFRNSE